MTRRTLVYAGLLIVVIGLTAIFEITALWGNIAIRHEMRQCARAAIESKLQCWDDLLLFTLDTRGFDGAFDVFVSLYGSDPEVPKGCHGWGHVLGEAAYEMYTAGEFVEFRRETSYCGYGFYHGFLERMIGETGNAAEARRFCTELAERGEAGSTGTFRNCIHGIGHGTAAGLAENTPLLKGDMQKGIDIASETCREIAQDENELAECFDGIFNEFILDAFNDAYGFKREEYISKEDPFAFCHRQHEDMQRSCFFEYMGTFDAVFDGDFSAAAAFVARDVRDIEHAKIAIKKLAADFMQNDIVNDDYTPNVEVCRSLAVALEGECMKGIEVGFIAHGEPGKEWERGFAFCASSLLTDVERPICYRSMLAHFRQAYDTKKFTVVCESVPASLRGNLCPG